MLNPITGQAFESNEEYVQSLINSLAIIHKEKFNTNQDEILLLKELATNIPEDEVKSVVLKGMQDAVRIKRVQRANYPRDRGATHPLSRLLDDYVDMRDFVSIDYKEKGSTITKLIENLEAGKLSGKGKEMAETIKQVRMVKEGKLDVEIKTGKGGQE